MALCRIDRWRSNVVTFADGATANQHTCHKHPAVLVTVMRCRVLVTETCITGKVRATPVHDVISSATDTPIKVVSEDRPNYLLISRTMK